MILSGFAVFLKKHRSFVEALPQAEALFPQDDKQKRGSLAAPLKANG
jgi:hypothetical protein